MLRDFQRRLLSLGYDPGPVDGDWGAKTEAAANSALDELEFHRGEEPDIPFIPTVNFDVAMEVATHEAVIRQAYRDAGGRWTWSVGMTSATGHGVERYIGKRQSMQHCMNIYVWALRNYASQVDEAFAGLDVNEEQYAAAVSFHWNTGAIGRSDWVQHFRRGMMTMAEASFRSTRVTVGGRPNAGLQRRRDREADLMFHGEWSSNGLMTEYTRLNSASQPVWASAIKVDVSRELLVAFGESVKPKLDEAPEPLVVPPVPTLSPLGKKPSGYSA
jgi:lysozyme